MPARPMHVMGSPPTAHTIRLISARPRVMRTASVLSPRPRPAQMPHAIATTFFTAAHTSTPLMSRERYTRNSCETNASWKYAASSSLWHATTAADIRPWQISSAWLGPESAATRAGFPSTSATTSAMRRCVPGSMPFVRTTMGRSSGTSPLSSSQMPRRNEDGTTMAMDSAPSSTRAKSWLALTFAGSSKSVRWRGFLCVRLMASATFGECAHMRTSSACAARSPAAAVPQEPEPMTAILPAIATSRPSGHRACAR